MYSASDVSPRLLGYRLYILGITRSDSILGNTLSVRDFSRNRGWTYLVALRRLFFPSSRKLSFLYEIPPKFVKTILSEAFNTISKMRIFYIFNQLVAIYSLVAATPAMDRIPAAITQATTGDLNDIKSSSKSGTSIESSFRSINH